MTNLERRLIVHRRGKARMIMIKRVVGIVYKTALVIVLLPALVYYATGIRSSLSFFSHQTQSPFFRIAKTQQTAFRAFAHMEDQTARLEILGDYEITIPIDDTISIPYSVTLTDNGQIITDPWVYWSIADTIDGVTIDPETGLLTVSCHAKAAVIVIQADVAGLTALQEVTILDPPVLDPDPVDPEADDQDLQTKDQDTGAPPEDVPPILPAEQDDFQSDGMSGDNTGTDS